MGEEVNYAQYFVDPSGNNLESLKIDLASIIDLLKGWWIGSSPAGALPKANLSDQVDEQGRIKTGIQNFLSQHPLKYSQLGDLVLRLVDSPRFNSTNFVNIHPSPSIPAIIASIIVSFQNPNMTDSEVSPGYQTLENECVKFLGEVLGLNEHWEGNTCSGGTMANLTALTVARDKFFNGNGHKHMKEKGIFGLKGTARILITSATHYSIKKCAWLLGFGTMNLISIPTKVTKDELEKFGRQESGAFTLQPDFGFLEKQLEYFKNRNVPVIAIVPTLGTLATGSIERPDLFAKVVKKVGIEHPHIHVDAATGGIAMASPEIRKMIRNLNQVDSITVDPHKWGFVQYPAGFIMFKKKADQGQIGHVDWSDNIAKLAPTIEGSRSGLAAASFWVTIQALQHNGYSKLVERCIQLARHFAKRISEDSQHKFQTLHNPTLNTVAFSTCSEGAERKTINNLNKDLHRRLRQEGDYMIGYGTKLNDIRVPNGASDKSPVEIEHLRAVFMNPYTSEEVVDHLCDNLLSTYSDLF